MESIDDLKIGVEYSKEFIFGKMADSGYDETVLTNRRQIVLYLYSDFINKRTFMFLYLDDNMRFLGIK